MASETFIDTGGFFAALNPHDEHHANAARWFVDAADAPAVTTDYVLDETVTLLQSRKQSHLIEPWLSQVLAAPNCRIVWMDSKRFEEVRRFLAKHADKQWSFTDCFSFCVMSEQNIHRALAHDEHFRQAGFETLLTTQFG